MSVCYFIIDVKKNGGYVMFKPNTISIPESYSACPVTDYNTDIYAEYMSVILKYIPLNVVEQDKLVATFGAILVDAYDYNTSDIKVESNRYESIYFDIVRLDGMSDMIHILRPESYFVMRDKIKNKGTRITDNLIQMVRDHNESMVKYLDKLLRYQSSCRLIHRFGDVKCAYGDITLVATVEKIRKCLIGGIQCDVNQL